MIIFFPAGQLGNQIFQFCYLDEIRKPHETIVSSRCDYFKIFDVPERNYIFLNKYFRFIIRRIFAVLGWLRVISTISQKRHYDEKNNEIFETSSEYKTGLFFWIRYVEGFFQSEVFIPSKKNPLLKSEYMLKAENFLKAIPADSTKVFVHIRRGDYLTWNILGDVDPSLPHEYYEKLIALIAKENPNATFIFLSNDVPFVEKEFAGIPKKIISRNDVATDFAIMSFCDIGILSNSTLSWWGGYNMKNGSTAYAPQYWLGWKREMWYPRGIETDKFKYILVRSKVSV